MSSVSSRSKHSAWPSSARRAQWEPLKMSRAKYAVASLPPVALFFLRTVGVVSDAEGAELHAARRGYAGAGGEVTPAERLLIVRAKSARPPVADGYGVEGHTCRRGRRGAGAPAYGLSVVLSKRAGVGLSDADRGERDAGWRFGSDGATRSVTGDPALGFAGVLAERAGVRRSETERRVGRGRRGPTARQGPPADELLVVGADAARARAAHAHRVERDAHRRPRAVLEDTPARDEAIVLANATGKVRTGTDRSQRCRRHALQVVGATREIGGRVLPPAHGIAVARAQGARIRIAG